MTQKNISLLPNGLTDLLPAMAEKESYLITQLMGAFSKFGYRRVKPPLVEFEETLLAKGPGQSLAHKTFRIMDPLSGRMMGVRADTTAQISRIAQSRLKEEARPLRLSYAADVLKVNGSQLRPERQFCQVGCEMIGVESAQDDVELCLNALYGLHSIGVKNLTIDLALPALVDGIYSAFDCDEATRLECNNLLQKRDLDGLKEIQSEMSNILMDLLRASGEACAVMESLADIKLPQTAQAQIQHLKEMYQELIAAFDAYGLSDIQITIDLIERSGFDYQNGLSFTLFSKEARAELGRGGRYGMEDENAAGFTLYMDSLMAVAQDRPSMGTETLQGKSWSEIKKLQDDGKAVIRKN